MTSREIRTSFLDYFAGKGHTIVRSSPVIPFEDPTLLFTNAGMNQFKDVFLGAGRRNYTRAVDTQKCIRVSGKHNDLEEVGRDTYHHTFFEMLGNWSFGDYYKDDAIRWAWELLTKVWGLPKKRLWATVYRDDAEAEELWKSVTDIDPSHVLKFGEKDNFWEMGETGPCGPCSEIHFDKTTDGTAPASLVNAGSPDLVEIWNLVFIQFNRGADGKLSPLPAKHVDTGMGFERICAVLQGKTSNYDTDVFAPLISAISKRTGYSYGGDLASPVDIAMRVIADHSRALAFAIADGALPSNDGRGYVLRRLLRRAARFGRTLSLKEPFLGDLVPVLCQTMGDVFSELPEKENFIRQVLRSEEESFNITLDRGLDIFAEIASAARSRNQTVLPADEVFKLYDTYGFPADLTALLAREQGFAVDELGFQRLMDEQRARSREARGSAGAGEASEGESVGIEVKDEAKRFPTEGVDEENAFNGYDALESEAEVVKAQGRYVLLSETPFYGEQGGQVGDTGSLSSGEHVFEVADTQKSGGVPVHILSVPGRPVKGAVVKARVDAERRINIMKNHTATHLVHAALRSVLGTHVHQAGSLVAPGYLRFDFSHFKKVTPEELRAIEDLVNEKINADIQLTHHRNIPFNEAKKMGALMFFGDKYGDRVNVVQFGEFSKEFCGGTHIQRTREIGYFKFRFEGSVASGTRRIEAVTGDAARLFAESKTKEFEALITDIERDAAYVEAHAGNNSDLSQALGEVRNTIAALRKGVASAVSTDLKGIFAAQERLFADAASLKLTSTDLVQKVEKQLQHAKRLTLSRDAATLVENTRKSGQVVVAAGSLSAETMEDLKYAGDIVRSKLGAHGVGVLFADTGGKVSIVCVVTDDLVKAKILDAGKIVSVIAKQLGGGGGGRGHMATAGAKDVRGIGAAVESVPAVIEQLLATYA